jgi:1-acyl-sn-glycerol-3-phosphate acyltransferase
MKYLSRLILKLAGWKHEGKIPDLKKFVVVVAPHTSNWDFVIGRLFYFSMGISAKVMIKKELFFFPLGFILKAIGGVPVERQRKTDIVERMAEEIRNSEEFILTITPEGTRKKVTEWKRGFYRIARAAGVPVLPGYFDYKRKVVGIGEAFHTTDDEDADMRKIKLFFKDITPKYPEKFSIGKIE